MAHSAQMTMDGRHVLCPDIGADKLWFFTLLPGGRIAPTSPRSHIKLPGGSGPRHLAAHPNGRWLYLICEISCSIVALSWELSSSSPAEEHTESPTVTEIGIAQLRHCWFLFHVGHGNDLPLGAELTATASERMQCIQLIAFLCVCLVSCLSISLCACVRADRMGDDAAVRLAGRRHARDWRLSWLHYSAHRGVSRRAVCIRLQSSPRGRG